MDIEREIGIEVTDKEVIEGFSELLAEDNSMREIVEVFSEIKVKPKSIIRMIETLDKSFNCFEREELQELFNNLYR